MGRVHTKFCNMEGVKMSNRFTNYQSFSKKWDGRFISLAQYIAQWSKDPSTKVGAIIVDSERRIIATGFNGFPRGISDDDRLDDRDTKYRIVVHAERNALLTSRHSLEGCRLYTWPMLTCSQCAAMVIQTNIIQVVSIQPPLEAFQRWKEDLQIAEEMYEEVGVRVTYLSPKETAWS